MSSKAVVTGLTSQICATPPPEVPIFSSGRDVLLHYEKLRRRISERGSVAPVAKPSDDAPAYEPDPVTDQLSERAGADDPAARGPAPVPEQTCDEIDAAGSVEGAILTLDDVSAVPWVPAPDALRAIAAVCQVTVADLKSARRGRDLIAARWVYYLMMRHTGSMSLPRIGYFCGGRDHSTVLHGIRQAQQRYAELRPALHAVMGKCGFTAEQVAAFEWRAGVGGGA